MVCSNSGYGKSVCFHDDDTPAQDLPSQKKAHLR